MTTPASYEKELEEEYEAEQVSPNDITRLYQMIDRLSAKEKEVERMESKVKELSEEARKLREVDIPELMRSFGLEKVRTVSGLDCEIRTVVRASLPKDPDKKKIAFDWLEANHHDNLIKRQITVTFDKDESKWATKFMNDLKKRKRPLEHTLKEDIHNQTLCAFLKGEVEKGSDVPLASFGAFIQTFAKIK